MQLLTIRQERLKAVQGLFLEVPRLPENRWLTVGFEDGVDSH